MRRLALLIVSAAVVATACGGTAAASLSAGATSAISATRPAAAGSLGSGPGNGGTATTPGSVATTPPVAAASLAPGWTLFTPPDRSFSIAFPGKPTHTSSSSTTTIGAMTINAYALLGSASRPGYIVTQDRFPAGAFASMAPGDVDRFLAGAVAAYAGSAGATTSHQTDLMFLGHPAKSATVTSGSKVQSLTVFVAGGDMYILSVVAPVAAQTAAAPFVGSFRLP